MAVRLLYFIADRKRRQDDKIVHHSSYEALSTSASNGCDLCRMLKERWLSWMGRNTNMPIKDPADVHSIDDFLKQNYCGYFVLLPDRFWSNKQEDNGTHTNG